MSELYLLSNELRAIAHILRFTDYILSITDDCDYSSTLTDIVSEYLYIKSKQLFEIYKKDEFENKK